jgi:phosphoglycerate-specific signal transduction histidine kinase
MKVHEQRYLEVLVNVVESHLVLEFLILLLDNFISLLAMYHHTVSLHSILKELSFFKLEVKREKLTTEVKKMSLDATHDEVINPQSI